ncbi:PglL family O-oligosaccharyltransferase [Ferrimonas lipolytica]|uniref:Uncharacterized protein n=1 Tax=Ferrimonas lipolytica TaxID=2724191 RepID=A0A6H1UJQ3_9GAMM|nr:Wzy polymerase domain-containing protein [Ferrimonas lipolytica]QIZ78543.1 hypothetical protein HER31_17550 [Ferrimonas lipolytica]
MNLAKDGYANKAMVFFCGSLFLFSMHYFQPNAGGSGLSVANNNMVWISIALICATGFSKIIQNEQIHWSPILTGLATVIGLLLLPYCWSSQPWVGEASARACGLIAWLLLAIAITQIRCKSALDNTLWLVVIGSMIQALICLAQFLQPDWFIGIRNHRPVGSFYQPNVVSSLLSTALALAIWLHHNAKPAIRLVLLACMALIACVSILIMSRTGVLAAIAITVAMLCLLKNRNNAIKIVFALILGAVLAPLLQSTLDTEGRQGLSNPGYRTTLYGQSLQLITEKPVLGHGIGSFSKVYTERLAQLYQQDSSVPMLTTSTTHPHNELLFWWVEGGAIPVLAIILFALFFSIAVWRRGNLFNKAMWISTIPIILHTQTEYPLYHSATHLALLTLLIIAAVPTTSITAKRFKNKLEILPKFFIGLGVVATCFLMLTNLHTTSLIHDYVKSAKHEYLQQVVNPFLQTKLINMQLGTALLRSQDPEALKMVDIMMEEEATVRPSVGAYLLWYHANLAMKDNIKAATILAQAAYLFPKSKQFMPKPAEDLTADSPPASATP